MRTCHWFVPSQLIISTKYGTSFSIISNNFSFWIYSLQSIHELITQVLMVQNELKLREL
ncbi:unnamed protein product [Paramecium octaurelia]|uniref:Uncharacterized protein n=1 Tax=Paramecium octaurelia TaxID=43137 RepID=A0A8S1WM56_PAROT|nr:unnamed protein product [Paramecium octaurelia]